MQTLNEKSNSTLYAFETSHKSTSSRRTVRAGEVEALANATRHGAFADMSNIQVVGSELKGKKLFSQQLGTEIVEIVDMKNINLNTSDFSKCEKISDVDFSQSDLSGCNFSNVEGLNSCSFDGAQISNTNFANTNIMPQTLVEAYNTHEAIVDNKEQFLALVDRLKSQDNSQNALISMIHNIASLKYVDKFTTSLETALINLYRYSISSSVVARTLSKKFYKKYKDMLTNLLSIIFPKSEKNNYEVVPTTNGINFNIPNRHLKEMRRQHMIGREGAKREMKG